jgi:hypothetical protein
MSHHIFMSMGLFMSTGLLLMRQARDSARPIHGRIVRRSIGISQ